jgi:predicted RNA-binding protein associated with RNAse of E/G family
MDQVTVRKLDHAGRQVISYPGHVLERDDDAIVLRTYWDREPMDLGFVVLEPDDRWTETFYADRWYNVFEIRASNGRLKGWYCNVTRPARITAEEVVAEDLALDLWVAADGETRVLDEGEFAELGLSPAVRERALEALAELRARAQAGESPFNADLGGG